MSFHSGTNSPNGPRSAFDDAARAWRASPFPSGSTNDEIDELHAELVNVDNWVAEVLVPYIDRQAAWTPAVDVQAGIQSVRTQASHLLEVLEDPAEKSAVESYDRYAQLLEAAYERFLEITAP